MTRGLSRKDIFGILILCFLLSVPLFLFAMPDGLDEVYYHNWICDMICFLISFAVLIGMYAKGRIDIFSPVVFVSVIYILMFFIAPVYQIAVGETSIFGVTDLFDYGVKGSIVALLGFLSFCAVYMRRYQKIPENRGEGSVGRLSAEARRNLSKWVLLAWTLDFVLGLTIVAATQGFSISYILTFGMMGGAEVFETTSTTLGFIGQFTRSIVSLYLIYFCVSDKKVMKGILFVLTAGLEVINGFRYMIVILICGLFYLYHMLRGKKISLVKLLGMSVLLAVLIGIVGYTRNSVRAGTGFSMEGFGLSTIMDAVIGNFEIYKSYYSIIKAVPAMTPYLYFDQIVVYTLVMAIPRAIWPGKPSNPGTEAQLYGINRYAVVGGFAYPCLGEYYYGFGTIGVVVFMGIIGAWLAKISNRYRRNAQTELDLVIYCIAVPLMLQLLIRGYTPSNFYLVLALFIPYWAVKAYAKRFSGVEGRQEF